MIKEKLEEIKEQLAENKKLRNGLIAGGMFLVLWYLFSSSGPDQTLEERRAERLAQQQTSVLGVSSALGSFEQQEAQSLLERLTDEFSEREKSLTARERRQAAELEEINQRLVEVDSNVARVLSEMESRMEELQRNAANNRSSSRDNRDRGSDDVLESRPQAQRFAVTGDDREYESSGVDRVLRRPQTQIVTQAPQRLDGGVIRTVTQRDIREVRESGTVDVREVQTNTLTSRNQRVRRDGAEEEMSTPERSQPQKQDTEFHLAMGSIISGTTINGVAAPTNVGRHRDPIPVVMRVKREAVMPNFRTLDIRECFMLGSAVGDLGSSRVMLRAEAISCITDDGEAIERNITAYAVSADDGMAGIPGTVVERSNTMIANTLKAGFLSGFAEAAAPNRIQSLNTNPTSRSTWESEQLDRYATSGALRGAGNALERVADYYMAMAESVWPVVELLPGIEIDFIVQRGMTIKLDGNREGSPLSGATRGRH